MIRNLIASKIVDVETKVRALAKQQLLVGDFFTGSGSFSLSMKALVNALESQTPHQGDFEESLAATWLTLSICFYEL